MIRTRVLFVCGNGLQALNKIRNVVRAAGREDACQNHAKPWDSKRYAQCIVNIRTRRHAQRAADNQRCQLRGGGLAVTVQRSLPDALSKLNKSLNSDGHNNR